MRRSSCRVRRVALVGAAAIGSRGEIERLHRDDQGLERARRSQRATAIRAHVGATVAIDRPARSRAYTGTMPRRGAATAGQQNARVAMTTVDRRDIPHPAHVRAGPQFSQRRGQREGSFRKVKGRTIGDGEDERRHEGHSCPRGRGRRRRVQRHAPRARDRVARTGRHHAQRIGLHAESAANARRTRGERATNDSTRDLSDRRAVGAIGLPAPSWHGSCFDITDRNLITFRLTAFFNNTNGSSPIDPRSIARHAERAQVHAKATTPPLSTRTPESCSSSRDVAPKYRVIEKRRATGAWGRKVIGNAER